MELRPLRDRKHQAETLIDLRGSAFDRTLIIISVSTCIWIIASNVFYRSLPWEATALALVVEIICGISYVLRADHPQAAIYELLIGLWVCNAIAAYIFGLPVFLYLFSLIGLTASMLTSRPSAVVTVMLSSLFMLALRPDFVDWHGTLLPPLLMGWVTLLMGYIFFQTLYEALDMAWGYEDYAVRQMDEARDHRGELMQLTKALVGARADLERANAQLRHARNAAEEAQRLKAQFAANVSHELRTPINLIVGFSEMMAMAPQAYRVPLPAPYRADIRTLYRSAKHLQSLINDVLDVSQIEAGQMAVIKVEGSPSEVIMEAASLIRELIESKGLNLNVVVPDQVPDMWLDRTRIRQVLLNLLGNAVRFTDQGTITVTAKVQESCLLISVADTGIGIRGADLERVFEEFQQLESSLSRRQGGTGLGLTLSKHFVELHGGQMWVESEGLSGRGTTFNFTLPYASQLTTWGPALPTSPGASQSDATYFVVFDDDPAIIQLFERYTSKHRAIGVQDKDEAMRLVKTIRPTAVVMDKEQLSTPMLEAVQANGNQTPIISCTMPSGRRAIQMYGVADYLVKPVSYEAFQSALKRLGLPIQNVLVIDDDQDIVRMFSRMLRAMPQSYQIRTAYSGEEGLALVHEQRPDVVVLDLLMPNVDGFTVIQHMKTDPTLADIPIVLASARGTVEAVSATADGKMSVFKPSGFQPVELVRCIEALVDSFTPATEPGQ